MPWNIRRVRDRSPWMSTWARPDAYYRRIQEMRKRVLSIMGV
jgi:hypothetical protein